MNQHEVPQIEPVVGDAPLVTLFRHNLWANLLLFDACAPLDEGQLATTVVGTYGTLYDTLNHIARAEQGYLIHLTGRQPEARLREEHKPSLDALRAHVRQSGEGLIAVAAAATPADVVKMEWDGQHWPYSFGMILNQVINHATEHRAQIMTIMTQLGIEPPDLSGWAYADPRVAPIQME
jgi:uncharacterized damage-inducible protein DinB